VADPLNRWTLNDRPLEIDASALTGLKDIQGTFTGLMDMNDGMTELFTGDGTQMVYFYASRKGNLIQHWFWTIRERLFKISYPTELIFSGPATFTTDVDPNGLIVTHIGTIKTPLRNE
jgi:hypothetical protein